MISPSLVIACISIICILSTSPRTGASNHPGFTIDLIHRDSPHSPLHISSISPSQRWTNALQRSFHRVRRLSASSAPVSTIKNAQGEFLLEYSIGTPPFRSFGIMDTGSDITWTQCKPCVHCFNQTLPFFQPETSSTYKKISCNSTICGNYDGTFCDPTNNSHKTCLYNEGYGDGSYTEGDLASDTVTFRSTRGEPVSFPNFAFGCGHKNNGIFSSEGSGIVGLGPGTGSLIRQLDHSIEGKFSYCLAPFVSDSSKTSMLNFGKTAIVEGEGVVSTPLYTDGSQGNFYFLKLEGMSVGKKMIKLLEPEATNDKVGNIIIDSGTTLTFLPERFYEKLRKTVKRMVKGKRIKDPTGSLDLCYSVRETNVKVPKITVHFKGADLKLNPENTFFKTSNVSLCFTFRPESDVAIYGNLAQANFLVGYDMVKKTVSFKPMDCTKSS